MIKLIFGLGIRNIGDKAAALLGEHFGSMDALRQMEAQRRPLYLAAADAVIPNNGTLDDALHAAMEALDEIFDS